MDDLTTGLAKARRQPWLTRSTGIMLGLVLVCGGFLAGVKVQQAYGSSSTTGGTGGTNAQGQLGTRGQQGQQLGQQGQQQGTTAQPVVGKVKLVQGTTVYIETADGRTVTVRTTDRTVVASPAELKDLAAGTSVTVQGTGTDTITASVIIKTG